MLMRKVFGFLSPQLTYFEKGLQIEEFPIPENALILVNKQDLQGNVDLKIGDSIKTGEQVLSTAKDFLAYSTVSGTITDISNLNWIDEEYVALTVKTGEDNWDESIKGEEDFLQKSKEELLQLLIDAQLELPLESKKPADAVIVNCVETDLAITKNRAILEAEKDKIKKGLDLLKYVTGAPVILAITDNQKQEAQALSASLLVVKPVYPNGMDQMIKRAYAQEKNTTATTITIGLEYLIAMVTALNSGQPRIEKTITLIGENNKPLKNIKVRIGTLASDLLKINGITLSENDRIVLGGPMRGKAVHTANFPITADTDALMVQKEAEITEMTNNACINCGKCVKACPYNLQANLLSRCSEFTVFEKCEELDIDFCIECGLCSYVCTARRPIVQYIQFAKKQIKKMKEEELQA